jgi:zinc protease
MNAAIDLDLDPNRDAAHSGIRYVRSIGGIEEYRLSENGMRVLFMPTHAAPIALLMLTYDVGSRHESAGSKGASHMIEHMMFKGSARFNKEQKASIFDLLHPVGAQANATTWLDRTNYFNLVPLTHLETAAEIEADRMRNLRIAPGDLDAERAVVLNEHDMYAGDPLEKLNQIVWHVAFPDHPYGHPVLGSRDDIIGLTRERLFAHYHRYYWPNNATLTVIGDVERERMFALVRKHFAQLPAAEHALGADDEPEAEHEQQGERRATVEQADQSGWVMLAYKMPNGLSADADALELLGSILTAGKLSRLYRPLIASGLAASVWASAARLKRQGLFQVQAMLGSGQDHRRAEQTIREAIDAIRRDGVAQDELQRAKGRLRGSLLTSRDGPVAIALQINDAIAAGDWTLYATSIDRIAAVEAADVQRVAHRYLIDKRLTVGHLIQEAEGDGALSSERAAAVL